RLVGSSWLRDGPRRGRPACPHPAAARLRGPVLLRVDLVGGRRMERARRAVLPTSRRGVAGHGRGRSRHHDRRIDARRHHRPRRGEIERLARKARLGKRVVFTGSVPHESIRSHYALFDAFVVPRRDERAARTVTPLKPYEALAMERPLVVADLPALVEIAAPD